MGKKTVVVLLVGLTLASVHLAEAQQQAKMPKIGLLYSWSPPLSQAPHGSFQAEVCANLVMLRARTSPSSIDTPTGISSTGSLILAELSWSVLRLTCIVTGAYAGCPGSQECDYNDSHRFRWSQADPVESWAG